MLLWDLEMKADLPLLGRLTPRERLAITLTEIERTAGIVLSASSPAHGVYRTCLEKFHETLESGEYMPVLDDELHDELLMASLSHEWGVGPLLAAMAQYVGEPATLMDSDCAVEVLGLCYQAVMEYQEIGDITPESERRCPALLETIRFQQDLISRGARR